jgi:hypothetical protein
MGENQHDPGAGPRAVWRADLRQGSTRALEDHNLLVALRTSGLSAPLVVDGAINGAVFRAYVEQQLAPTLIAGRVIERNSAQAFNQDGRRLL